jgi:CheY-like chemotaxis protein
MSPQVKTVSVPAPSLLATLLEAATAPVFLLDTELRVRGANAEGAALLARPADLLNGTRVDRWLVPSDLPALQEGLARARRTGRPEEVAIRFRTARSKVRARRARLHRDPGSGAWVLTTWPEDEEVDREEDGPRLAFLRSLPRHFFLELDLEGVVRRAHGLGRTHLLDDEEVEGRPYRSLLRGTDGDVEVVDELLAAAAEGRGWRGVHWHLREDGVPFLVRIYARPARPAGPLGPEGVFVSGLDVDRPRREMERAEGAARAGAVGLLAGRMAVRTSRMLEQEAERLAGEAGADPGAEGGALARRIRPLRDVTRAFLSLDGAATERIRAIPVPRLLQRVTDDPELPPLRWASEDLPGSVPPVLGPPVALERVFRLLLSGMTGEGPRGAPTWATARATDRAVILSFTRQGEPLEEAAVRSLDHPEEVSDLPSAELASARALAAALGARLWTGGGSGPGGTVFSVELPRAMREAGGVAAGGPDAADEDIPMGGATVLLVDDDPAIRASVGRFLTKAGYEVREAWSGRSAMAQITGGSRPELMVTDLRMLDGSGFWLLDQLQRYFPDLLRNTVILTGDEERGRELAQRSGCPLMLKPLELGALVDQLDRLST